MPYAQGIKNDINDSIAIAEAASCPGVRTVTVKTVEQQNLKLHSLKLQAVHQRTQKRNALRTHLSKRGIGAPLTTGE
jgi:transposase